MISLKKNALFSIGVCGMVTLLAASASAGVLPKTVGSAKILGIPLTYNIGGVLNYTQAFGDAESGLYNSNVNANATYNVGNGYSITNTLKIDGSYNYKKKKDVANVEGGVALIRGNGEFSVGYGKHISNELFSTVGKTNGDVSFSHNQLSNITDKYSVYANYTISVRDVEFDASIDADADGFIGFKAPLLKGDLSASIYRLDKKVGGYTSYSFNMDDDITASVGVGIFNNRIGSVLSMGEFLRDDLYVYGDLVGYDKQLSGTAGVEYDMERLSIYAEVNCDIYGYESSQKSAIIGAKFVF